MSKDFANRSKSARSSKPQNQRKSRAPATQASSHWKWLFTGAILGSFVTFLLFLSGTIPAPAPTAAVPDNSTAKTNSKTPEKMPKPRFEFYQMLKESEVVVDRSARQYDGGGTRHREKMEFLLQVGSFRNPKDADGLHAQLAMQGFDSAVETVKVRNGSRWHRVLVGPYSDKTKLGRNRAKLINNGMETLVIERQAK